MKISMGTEENSMALKINGKQAKKDTIKSVKYNQSYAYVIYTYVVESQLYYGQCVATPT